MKMHRKQIIEWVRLTFVVVFIIFSVLLMLPHVYPNKAQNRAKTLTKIKSMEETTERIDYVDKNGTITVAADVGYATMITVITANRRLEHFYDEKGAPIRRYSGYYGILREYDEEGRNYHIQYLGIDNLPVITGEGYSDKYLTFYENGKIKTEKYYDPFFNPICSSAFGFGLINEYDENRGTKKTTYLNDKDEPMLVGLGYAIVNRNLYRTDGVENGKVESEFYFDEKGIPIALSLGQYGVHKEYDENGQEAVLTYLDEDGNPIVSAKGYTTVKKTYHPDNRTASERYFDIEGNPFHLLEGQYGIKMENDQLIYLDQNGREVFNIKRLLYNQTWIIIPCTIVLICISGYANKHLNFLFFIVYICVIIYLTLLYRESDVSQAAGLLWQYKKMFIDTDARDSILKNIWLFIPLGAILYKMHPPKRILFISLALSCSIEGLQYITGTGICELDDVISNTLGSIIGLLMMHLVIHFMLCMKNKFVLCKS